MLKTLMTATAATALLASSYAFAQQPSNMAPATTSQVQTSQSAAGSKFITAQTADQWLASKFKGTDVIGTNNEKIGDVSDVLFDNGGKVEAYIVGVGGFLGIGSKDVAIMPASFQVQPATDRDNMKLKLAMTKDELKDAPAFTPYKDTSRTSMAPTSTTPAPTPAPSNTR